MVCKYKLFLNINKLQWKSDVYNKNKQNYGHYAVKHKTVVYSDGCCHSIPMKSGEPVADSLFRCNRELVRQLHKALFLGIQLQLNDWKNVVTFLCWISTLNWNPTRVCFLWLDEPSRLRRDGVRPARMTSFRRGCTGGLNGSPDIYSISHCFLLVQKLRHRFNNVLFSS